MAFQQGSSWKGFYDAPFPYGRQEFTCRVTEMREDGTFVANGDDKEGQFSLKGDLVNIQPNLIKDRGQNEDGTSDIHFIKDYLSEDGYKGIDYKGVLVGTKITGSYTYLWKKGFISKTVTGIFEMNYNTS